VNLDQWRASLTPQQRDEHDAYARWQAARDAKQKAMHRHDRLIEAAHERWMNAVDALTESTAAAEPGG